MKENIKLCFYLLLRHPQGLSIISKMGIIIPAWWNIVRVGLNFKILLQMRMFNTLLNMFSVNIKISYLSWYLSLCLVAQSCPTPWDHMDWGAPGSSVHGASPGKNTRVGCHALLQGIFPTKRSNLGLPHCRRILYCLSHQGRPVS